MMKRAFFDRGTLSRWAWFWSRLGIVEGVIWAIGWLAALVIIPMVIMRYGIEGFAYSIAGVVFWFCAGICSMWTCLVLGGFTCMGHPDPWDN
jgi:hypothetical protein